MNTPIKQYLHDTHVQANDSDPFAAFRLATRMKNGLITADDFPTMIREQDYAINSRKNELEKKLKEAKEKGGFVLFGRAW